jgi:hypothetical protein
MDNSKPQTIHEAVVAAAARASTAQQLGKIIAILEGNFISAMRKVPGESKRLDMTQGLIDELNEV